MYSRPRRTLSHHAASASLTYRPNSAPRAHASSDRDDHEDGRRFAIALTCKQIAAETLPLLYSSLFVFDTLNELDLFLRAIGEGCKYLRRLRILGLQSGEDPWTLGEGRYVCGKLASSAPGLREVTIVLDHFALGALKEWVEPKMRKIVHDTEPLVVAKVKVVTDIVVNDLYFSNWILTTGIPVTFWRSIVGNWPESVAVAI